MRGIVLVGVLLIAGAAAAGSIEGAELRALSPKILKIENARYNPRNSAWRAIATLTNSSGRTLDGPVYVACRLINEDGVTLALEERSFGTGDILPGEVLSVELIEFVDPPAKSIRHECGLQ